jgi:alkanesulfonate monooxygenase SsuD/methylene tetrahydromethanopterin reductase-like flavin-dependent oxidoreductase (luciferase family)
MCCYGAAKATKRVMIGTWIVNIYLRDPMLCAAAAQTVQDESDGRFILGLGVSHRPLLKGRGIEMGNGRDHLRHVTLTVREALSGATVPGHAFKFQSPKKPIPIYYGTLALETARLAGELADGLMLYLCTIERMRKSINAARESAVKHQRKPGDVAVTVGLPIILHDDSKRAFALAKEGLTFNGRLPFYNRLFARSGFEAEAAAMMGAAQRQDAGALREAVTERMVNELTLHGPASRCQERLEEYRKQGAELPILAPRPVDEDYATCVRRILKAFAKAN